MRGIELRRPRARSWLADRLAPLELIACEIDLDPRRQPVPHVRLDPFTLEVDVRGQQLTAEKIVHDERSDVALPTAGILRRPVVLLVGGIQAPGLANGLFELRESERQASPRPVPRPPRARRR